MIQSATPTIPCFSPVSLPIEARFDGPQLTSDGGLVWLALPPGLYQALIDFYSGRKVSRPLPSNVGDFPTPSGDTRVV